MSSWVYLKDTAVREQDIFVINETDDGAFLVWICNYVNNIVVSATDSGFTYIQNIVNNAKANTPPNTAS
jgi:hypothetical protein